MDYSNFSVEELASDDRFISWVKNDCSQEDKDFWQSLTRLHPELQDKIDRARILVINVDRAEDEIDPFGEEIVNEIWHNVLAGIEDEDPQESRDAITKRLPGRLDKTSRPQRWRTLAFSVAASVGLFVSAFFLFTEENGQHLEWYSYNQEAPGFVELVNTGQTTMKVEITDGSVISLEAGSRIKYKRSYTSDTIRKVYLKGEAFFDVARNPKKRFVVFTNDVATEVLGTSFRIKTDAGTKDVVVKVKRGKVSVYSVRKQSSKLNNPKEGVILLPNQEVVYSDKADVFEKKIVDTPELLKATIDDNFVFDNIAISTVFVRLEEAYGVEILFDRETMKNCFLTVSLGSESLFEKLNVICRTIGASYEIIDAKVVITSSGCKTSNHE